MNVQLWYIVSSQLHRSSEALDLGMCTNVEQQRCAMQREYIIIVYCWSGSTPSNVCHTTSCEISLIEL